MSVRIFRENDDTVVMFERDGDQAIRSTAGYVEAHHAFIAAGWSETPMRVLCPECAK